MLVPEIVTLGRQRHKTKWVTAEAIQDETNMWNCFFSHTSTHSTCTVEMLWYSVQLCSFLHSNYGLNRKEMMLKTGRTIIFNQCLTLFFFLSFCSLPPFALTIIPLVFNEAVWIFITVNCKISPLIKRSNPSKEKSFDIFKSSLSDNFPFLTFRAPNVWMECWLSSREQCSCPGILPSCNLHLYHVHICS